MGDFIRSTLGLVSYSVVLFAAGALIGKPLYAWVSKKMPWNK
jgi:hypothetical protein